MSKYCITACYESGLAYWDGSAFTWDASKGKLYKYKGVAHKHYLRLLNQEPALFLVEIY